jgi:hypothetical protein
MRVAARAIAIVAWAVGLIVLANWSDTDRAVVGAVAATVALGFLVGRWPLLLVPLLPGLLLAGSVALADPDTYYEGPPAIDAAYTVAITLAVMALLAVGVLLHRLMFRGGRR